MVVGARVRSWFSSASIQGLVATLWLACSTLSARRRRRVMWNRALKMLQCIVTRTEGRSSIMIRTGCLRSAAAQQGSSSIPPHSLPSLRFAAHSLPSLRFAAHSLPPDLPPLLPSLRFASQDPRKQCGVPAYWACVSSMSPKRLPMVRLRRWRARRRSQSYRKRCRYKGQQQAHISTHQSENQQEKHPLYPPAISPFPPY